MLRLRKMSFFANQMHNSTTVLLLFSYLENMIVEYYKQQMRIREAFEGRGVNRDNSRQDTFGAGSSTGIDFDYISYREGEDYEDFTGVSATEKSKPASISISQLNKES